MIEATPELTSVAQKMANADLVTFENYELGVKINSHIYDEAKALYSSLLPLVMEFMEVNPYGRIRFLVS